MEPTEGNSPVSADAQRDAEFFVKIRDFIRIRKGLKKADRGLREGKKRLKEGKKRLKEGKKRR